jgi:hypothetical protein
MEHNKKLQTWDLNYDKAVFMDTIAIVLREDDLLFGRNLLH